MKEQYEQLCEEMIADINRCLQMQLPETENVSNCFWIAINYWEQLKRKIKGRPFKRQTQEIDFFKKLKPKFTSQIHYFAILSEALLFVPAKAEDQICFWQKEMERLIFFRNKHKKLVEYCEGGNHNLDTLWFTRVNPHHSFLKPMTYDSDKFFCSSHDHLVRSLLAHRMYNEYCKKKLESLVGRKESSDVRREP